MDKTQDAIGKLLSADQQRDAIHIAVAPVVAARTLKPGAHVGLNDKGEADDLVQPDVGIIDPFVLAPVKKGQRVFLFLYPNTITSLRHEWTHPAFSATLDAKSASERWMRDWAMKHMGEDYYGGGKVSEESAYNFAIEAGHNLNIGPYESARDHIDHEWWRHWETITGCEGKQGEYFSCAC